MGEMMTEAEVAAHLRVSASTLRRWRRTGDGPSWSRVGRRPRYSRIELDAWLLERSGAADAD
jgi:excisionase family DNA binding protein